VVEAQRLEARQGAAVQQDGLSRPQERPHGFSNSNIALPSRLRPEVQETSTGSSRESSTNARMPPSLGAGALPADGGDPRA
jgi:hypothetical protein